MPKKGSSTSKAKHPKSAKKNRSKSSPPKGRARRVSGSTASGKKASSSTEFSNTQDLGADRDPLSLYLQELGKYNVLTREEEIVLAIKVKNGDEEAFNQLVRSNLRFVVSVANRYKGFGLSLEDLINEGNIGLIHAIRRFDPERGFKLITYAVWWIRQSIMHAIADHTGTVRLPIKQAGLMPKIAATRRAMRQEFGREASTEELAESLKLKVSNIENVLRANRTYLSLDAPISEADDTSYLDMLEEKNSISAEENLFQHSLHDEIDNLLRDLEPREQEIIRMRFGFDADPMTLEEIGQKIGLSRERIRQIEKKVIRRFRARAKNKTLLDFLR
ncbi:MAG: RNA polymerase sigma factor RpoD/SigA [Nitrospinota bacterium]